MLCKKFKRKQFREIFIILILLI